MSSTSAPQTDLVVKSMDCQSPAMSGEKENPAFAHPASSKSEGDYLAWLQPLSTVFLLVNFVADMYISIVRKALWSIAFVVFSYTILLLLFACLRALEGAPEGSSKKGRLKFAVWLLLSTLTILFTYRVADTMPLPVAVILWAMAALVTLGGSFALLTFRPCSSAANKFSPPSNKVVPAPLP